MRFNGTTKQRMRLLAELPRMRSPIGEELVDLHFEMGDDAQQFIALCMMCVAAIGLSGKRIGWSFVERAVEVEGWSLTQMNYFVGVAKLNGVWKE